MLINCPECGEKISDLCVFCVHCGYPYRELHIIAKTEEEIGKNKIVDSQSEKNDTDILNIDLKAVLKTVLENKKDKYSNSKSLNEEEMTHMDSITGVSRGIWTYMYDYERIPKHIPSNNRNEGMYPDGQIPEDKKAYFEGFHSQKTYEDRKSKSIPKETLSYQDQTTKPWGQVSCPYCQSTNVKKIGTAGKLTSIGLFGLASSKVGKQWHCNKCGSDF